MFLIRFAACLVLCIYVSAFGQPTQISGREADISIVFDDTLAAAIEKKLVHNGREWYSVHNYQYYSIGMAFDTTGLAAGSFGLTSADTVKVLMEFWHNTVRPGADSTGYVDFNKKAKTVVVSLDSTTIAGTPRLIRSFHGASDPDIIPSVSVRFYTSVVGGFTSAGLPLRLTFFKQP